MSKLFPLIQANLKSFFRDWKSVFLLIIFPLLLISSVFFSFNPNGVNVVPIGLVNSENISLYSFEEYSDNYFKIYDYKDIDDCIKDLKRLERYVCIDVEYEDSILLNVYFDNTREPIIWEIVQQIKLLIDKIQKQKTKEFADSVVDNFQSSVNQFDNIKKNLNYVTDEVDTKIGFVEKSIEEVDEDKDIIYFGLVDMIDNFEDIKKLTDNTKDDIETERGSFNQKYFNLKGDVYNNDDKVKDAGIDDEFLDDIIDGADKMNNLYVDLYMDYLDIISIIDSQSDNVESLETESKDKKIALTSNMNQIENSLLFLKKKNQDVKLKANNLGKEEKTVKKLVMDINSDAIVNPVIIYNNPVYIPKYQGALGSGEEENLISKFNLITLQTLYPSILILISLFLSLLVSSFITISYINSNASIRVKTNKGVFFFEFLSNYISSLLIIFMPVLCILVVGQWLFMLAIFSNLLVLFLFVFLFVSIFIFVGISISYLIKKESISLLLTTFILILIVFFSGFLIPMERMRPISALISSYLPTLITFSAFNKIVFYFQEIYHVFFELKFLALWFIVMLSIAVITKRVKRV